MSFHKNMRGDDLHPSKIRSIDGSPVSVVTPEFVEEVIIDITSQVLYVSTGVTNQDWTSIGGVGGIPALGDLSDVNKSARVNSSTLEWDEENEQYIHSVALPSTTIFVDPAGSDTTGTGFISHPFQTIKKALDSITDNSTIKRYTISVSPGTHIIDNSAGPLALKSFCNISVEGIRSAVFAPQDPSNDMFTGGIFTHLNGIIFTGLTGTSFVLRHEGEGNVFIQDCVLRDCANGFIVNSALNGNIEVSTLAVNNPASTTTDKVIEVQSGRAKLDDILIRSTAIVNTAIEVHGENSGVSIHNFLGTSPNLITAFKIYDGSEIIGVGNSIGYCTDGIIIYGSNTTVELDATKIVGCSNDGIRIEETGDNLKLSLFATTVRDCVGLNLNILNSTATIIGTGFTQLSNSYIIPGSKFYAAIIDNTEDDEGLNVLGELHVGTPINPTESVFGGGDSYTRGMLVYTATSGGLFTDVSEQARSASGSSFTFPELTIDSAIYMASDLQNESDYIEHFGVKTKVSVAKVGGSIVSEYWNGSAWVEVDSMEVDSGAGYYPHAKNYFQDTGSHQIRYNLLLASDSWTKIDPVGIDLGTGRYWVRFRVSDTLTVAPVFEQFKLHTNRFEINADGWPEYFGKARPLGVLPWHIGQLEGAANSPSNQDVYLSDNLSVGMQENNFGPSAIDRIGFNSLLPFDADTSSPVKFRFSWFGTSDTAGQVRWVLRSSFSSDGKIIYTSDSTAPAVDENEIEVIRLIDIGSNESGAQRTTEIQIQIADMVSRKEGGFGDHLWISLTREGPSDSYSGDAVITAITPVYVKWCEGGHI